jgi:hypothetical protein
VTVLVTVDGASVVVGVSVSVLLGGEVPVSVAPGGGASVSVTVCGPLCVRRVGSADVPGAAELMTGVVAGAVLGVVGDELAVSFTTA